MQEKITKFLKDNWFSLIFIIIFLVLIIVIIYSEREIAMLNKWSKLCSKLSATEIRVRASLDMKMGDREREWCKNTFYKLFK